MTAHLFERANEAGFKVNSPTDPERRGGTVCIDFEGANKAEHKLIERGFIIDYRPGGGIRVSPHFYNTIDEINAIIDAMKNIRDGK